MGNLRQFAAGFSNSGTSLVLTLPLATLSGTTLSLITSGPTSIVSGTPVLTHDTLNSISSNASGGVFIAYYQKLPITGGDTACTITWSSGGPTLGVLTEIVSVSAVDVNANSATPGTTGTVTTTQQADFAFAGAGWQAAATGWTAQTTGWTPFADLVTTSGTADIRLVTSYRILSAIGTYSDTWTTSALTGGAGCIITYKITAIGDGTMPVPPQRLRNPQNIH